MAAVALVVHPDRPDAAELAEKAEAWLSELGHRAIRPDTGPADRGLADAVAAVSLGGDGTMLRTVELAWRHGVPVLGVNLGRLGYLTEIEPARLQEALRLVLAGEFQVEERMALQVGVTGPGADGRTWLALNEAVVEKTLPGHTIRVTLVISGRRFVSYQADGMIVCTPTGSTAYNLSARGPILSPRVHAIVVTPVSPHMLFDRSLVLEPSESVELRMAPPRPAVLVVDGVSVCELAPDSVVACREAERPVRMVTFGGHDFHSILRGRFGLADR